MNKQIQIVLAVSISVAILLGFMLDHLLNGPTPVTPSTSTGGVDPMRRPPHRILFPVPNDSAARNDYLLRGRQVFFDKGCWTCHRLGTAEMPGAVNLTAQGPDLGDVGSRLTADEIFESIVNPNAVIAEPKERYSVGALSKMPSPVTALSADELLSLTSFLSQQTLHPDSSGQALYLPPAPAPLPAAPTPPPPSMPAPTPPLTPPPSSLAPTPAPSPSPSHMPGATP